MIVWTYNYSIEQNGERVGAWRDQRSYRLLCTRNGIGGDSGAGARENRGREEAEERAGSGSSKKAGIIY